ncbi:hypothetical protein V6Z11_D04G137700 [Gossypium hirsutum]
MPTKLLIKQLCQDSELQQNQSNIIIDNIYNFIYKTLFALKKFGWKRVNFIIYLNYSLNYLKEMPAWMESSTFWEFRLFEWGTKRLSCSHLTPCSSFHIFLPPPIYTKLKTSFKKNELHMPR